ncbi:MAG: OprO/OprP family phosphate-selective porin, partial [Planctomycetota bacterium]|nr:OprO/OprP family phosphate-selective porin [Planctomycetota bacterium]
MRRFWRTALAIASCAACAMAAVPGAVEAGEGEKKPEADAKKADADVKKAVDDYLKAKGVGDMKDVVTVSTGKMKIGALLQIWYSYLQDDNKTTRGAPNEGNDNDSFRIRRAEIKLSGEITPEVKWTLMIDPARAYSAATDTAASSVLQDAYIELGFIKYHTIWIGQGKRPLGREGNWSSARLPLPERAMLSRDASNGDTRDLGIKIVGEYKDTPVDWFTWQVGLFQGAGPLGQARQNRPDDNDDKDIVSRLVIRLFGKQGALLRDGKAGDFEIGFSRLDGKQGERRRGVTATA